MRVGTCLIVLSKIGTVPPQNCNKNYKTLPKRMHLGEIKLTLKATSASTLAAMHGCKHAVQYSILATLVHIQYL